MTYAVQARDDRALGCRVTTTAKSGRYRIVTDYMTDPGATTVARPLALRRAEGQAVGLPASTSASTRR